MKDITVSEEVCKHPQYRVYLLMPKCILWLYLWPTDSQFSIKIESGTRITLPVDPKPKSKIREHRHWVPEI